MTGSTENDTSLPYSGDIQAAQAAGDWNAIKEIFHHRLRREGAIPMEIRRDLEDPRTAEDENEEDSIDEYNRRVRGRRSLSLFDGRCSSSAGVSVLGPESPSPRS